jgi:hypothetical protein
MRKVLTCGRVKPLLMILKKEKTTSEIYTRDNYIA